MTYRLLVSDAKIIDLDATHEAFDGIDIEVESTTAKTPAALWEVVPGADALLVDAGTRVTPRVLDASERLTVVGRSGIGVDNVDVCAAAERGITVVNVPDYCLDEVSTHALALILGCVRKLPQFGQSVTRGEWDWSVGEPVHRLRGQTVGLVAFGQIARTLAPKLEGFGVDIVAYDPYVGADKMSGFGVRKVPFETLLCQSDIVSVHAPLTDETEGMFDAAAFESMGCGTTFVNTARGGLVVEEALIAALESGTVAASGLDVREQEPPQESSLSEMENVILTPHTAWYSEEAREELNRTVGEDIVRILNGESPQNPVEPDSAGW